MRRFIPSVIALFVALAFSVYQRDVLGDIFSRLLDVDPIGYFPLGLAGIAMVLARAAFLQSCSPGISLSHAVTADQTALAAGYGIALGGGAVGTALRIHMFTRWGLRPQSIGASIVATAVMPSFTTWGLPIIVLSPLIVQGKADDVEKLVFVSGIGLVVVSIVFWALALRFSLMFRVTGRIGASVQRILLRRIPQRFEKTRQKIVEAQPVFFSEELRGSIVALLRQQGFKILTASISTLIAAFFCLWTSATLFDAKNVSFYELLVAFSLVRVLIAVSPIPGAAGIAELGLIALLERSGVSALDATGTTLLYRFLTWFMPIVVGTVLWWRYTHTAKENPDGPIHHHRSKLEDTRGSLPLHGRPS